MYCASQEKSHESSIDMVIHYRLHLNYPSPGRGGGKLYETEVLNLLVSDQWKWSRTVTNGITSL